MALALVWVVFLGNLTSQLTRIWGVTGVLIFHWAEQHPKSIRAQSSLSGILAEIGDARQGSARLQSLLKVFPKDVSLQLKTFNYSCSNNLEVLQPLQQLATIENPEIFRSDINVQIRVMIDNLRLEICAYPTQSEMLYLMDGINALKMDTRERVIFNIYYSELLVHYGLIDDALSKLDHALEVEPSVDISIRQATLAGSVGRYDQALEILHGAIGTDEQRNFLLPSRREEIDDWLRQIESLQ